MRNNDDWLNSPCPIRSVLTRIGDTWSVLILMTLGSQDYMRFNMLKRAIPDISQKMLAQTLRSLACDGYVEREVLPTVPPQVEYRLTTLGRSLVVHLSALAEWAEAHRDRILAIREQQKVA